MFFPYMKGNFYASFHLQTAGAPEAGDFASKGEHITKAQDIINELNAVLDMDAGGEVAANLRRLYCYMIKRLSEANINKDPRLIREVIKLIEELNQSWKAITC
jgi:flagellar protein FliS